MRKNQFRDPNEDHNDVMTCHVPSDVAAEFLDGEQARAFFVSEPEKCILTVMRFISPGQADLFEAVVMPGPEAPPLTQFNLKGMRYTHFEENVEVNGRWGASFGEEWWHSLRVAETV